MEIVCAECAKLAKVLEQKLATECSEMKDGLETKHRLQMSTAQVTHEFEMKKLQNTMRMRQTEDLMKLKAEFKLKHQQDLIAESIAFKTEMDDYRAAMDMKCNLELAEMKEEYQREHQNELKQIQLNAEQLEAKWKEAFNGQNKRMKQLQEAYALTKAELDHVTEKYNKLKAAHDRNGLMEGDLSGQRQQIETNGPMDVKPMELTARQVNEIDDICAQVDEIQSNIDKGEAPANEVEIVEIPDDSVVCQPDEDETASNYEGEDDIRLLNVSMLESPVRPMFRKAIKSTQFKRDLREDFEAHCQLPKPVPVQAKSLGCDIVGCLREFATEQLLEAHLRVHAVLQKSACRVCGRIFTDQSNFDDHVQAHGDRPFKCSADSCGRKFRRISNLQRHMWDHEGKERPWKCTAGNCGERFYTQSSLDRHMVTHTGEKPFECTQTGCGKAFNTLANVQQHARTHGSANCGRTRKELQRTIEKKPQFHCDVVRCEYVAVQQKVLIRHMRKHTGSQPTACEHLNCGKMFSHRAKLALHMKTHSFKH